MNLNRVLVLIVSLFLTNISLSQSNKELFETGKTAFHADNFEDANKYFAQILSKESDSYDNCFYKALVYDINFDYDKAITECTSAISFEPKQKEIYLIRGTIYDKQTKLPEAIDDYSKAIKLDKNYVDAYFNRATDFQELKQYDDAIKDYSKVLKLNSSDDIAFYNRGKLYMEMKDNAKAINDFEQAIQIDKAWEHELRTVIDSLQKGQ
jgi:tetratricopeptide (TPR) repeat protein